MTENHDGDQRRELPPDGCEDDRVKRSNNRAAQSKVYTQAVNLMKRHIQPVAKAMVQ